MPCAAIRAPACSTAQPLLEAMQNAHRHARAGRRRYLVCMRPDNFARLERDAGRVPQRGVHRRAGRARCAPSWRPTDLLGHFSGAGPAGADRARHGARRRALGRAAAREGPPPEFAVGDRTVQATPRCAWARRGAQLPSGKLEAMISDALDAVRSALAQRAATRSAPWSARRHRRARAGLRRGLGQAHPGGPGGEPLPPRAAAHRQPRRRRRCRCSTCWCACSTVRARKSCPRNSCPRPSATTCVATIDRWVIMAAARFARRTRPGCLFVRCRAPARWMPALLPWLEGPAVDLRLEPRRLLHPGHRGRSPRDIRPRRATGHGR